MERLNSFLQSLNESKAFHVIREIWNFKIIKVENSSITIGTLAVGLLLLVFGFFLAKSLSRRIYAKVFQKLKLDLSLRHTIESFTFYLLFVFFALFAMKMANIPLTVFTVIGGALAIGFGFGSQNVVNNFISGVILMVERPVKVGDFVDVDGVFGSVDEIGMRSTRIKTFGNKHMIVPNSYFLEKNVLNWTLTDHFVRLPLRVGIAYGSDTEKAKELLLHAAQACKKVLNHKEQKVYFMDFADNSLNFELLVWIHLKDVMDRVEIESELRFKIDHLFREAGIVIAFPQRDVHLMPSDQAIRVSIDQSS